MTLVESAELIEPWLFSTLTGDQQLHNLTGGHIYGPIYPDEVAGVYITFQLMSLRDVRGVGTATIAVDAIYMVKGVCQTNTQDDLVPAVRRMFALLFGPDGHGVDVDVAGGHITCTRESTISYPQLLSDRGQTSGGGQTFLHLGCTARIRASTN